MRIVMAISIFFSPSFLSSKLLINFSAIVRKHPLLHITSTCFLKTMNSNPSSKIPVASVEAAAEQLHVPALSNAEMELITERTFHKYASSPFPKREGKGVAIVWFRNDLRILDNEALFKAWISSEAVLPVYCIDPRLFRTTYYFGFPKTGVLRAQFLMESLADLKRNLKKRGLDLLIKEGKPENILPLLAQACGAHTVYAQKETCSEEVNIERLVERNLQQLGKKLSEDVSVRRNSRTGVKLELVWGASMYHIDDLPFDCKRLPDVYTQFRKAVESKSLIRSCIKTPIALGPPPNNIDWGFVPDITQLGFQQTKACKGMIFVGGESAAISRVHEYFWKKDRLRIYKDTRNGMLGPDYSTKLSPWLACGSLSPRFIYEEVKRYETERESNSSTYWVLFELIWRDYFRFLSIKMGNSLFHPGGPRNIQISWKQDHNLFDAWRDGKTGYPLVDACMKELVTTGFMSNRGRQIVCSFLVRDMGIDWRMGAEWFETCLLDYDPCSNYGNWTYGAGVGNDPREDRYFSITKQAQTYDPQGEFVSYWLPELRSLPKERRNFPAGFYIKTIVPLKFGSSSKTSASASTRKPADNMPKGHGGRRMH